MGDVHELILSQGKQAALKRDDRLREAVDAAAGYLSDETGGIGCLYAGWCQAALPHKRLADDQVWEVSSEKVRLVVRPGQKPANGVHGKLIDVGVPYGARARLILLYMQSEAIRTQSPEVKLGNSMRNWLHRMGVPVGGTSVAMIREQADRISRCSLTFHIERGGSIGLVNQTIMESAMFDRGEGGQGDLFASKARLSHGFFEQLQKHPVPLEEAAVFQIANNSQAMDVYAWLAYRLHALDKPTPLTWAALKGQFGLGVGRMDNFRKMFLKSLELSLAVYPAAKVEVSTTGLLLHPSRPPVAPKQIAAR
jgi:hypothetical protein